jgi:hypothetical protein
MKGPDDPGETKAEPDKDRSEWETQAPGPLAAFHETPTEPDGAGSASPSDRLSVPGYEIVGELGRGGMGVVYKARHLSLKRFVALKMVLAGSHAGFEALARFKAEAEALARLQHPNIVQVYEIGQHGGLPFFALEFCAGGSLAGHLANKPWLPTHAAQLVEALARAVAAAHGAAVVHRDLKPANVLLTADGTPKITDFGLAKRLDEVGMTASGAVMGTPCYMAPEQARGERQAVGPAADIYALGAILYECLTGRPPFKADTVYETISQVIQDEPVRPSRLRGRLPGDLETICMKCLQKEPAKRYLSAAGLAEDLARFRAGGPIQARPIGRLQRAWRRIKRNTLLTGAAVGLVILMTGIVALALRGNSSPTGPAPAAVAAGPQEDELLQVVSELNRTDRGWRLEDLEARRKVVPPQQNSALRIAAARRLLPADWPQRRAQYDKAFAARPRLSLPRPDHQAALQRLLKPAQGALAEARALANYPQGRHAVNYARDFLTTLLPHAEATREVIELLSLDTLAQILAGRFADASLDCRAELNASRSLCDEPSAIAQLVHSAGVLMAIHDAERVLRYGEARAADVAAVQGLVAREAREPLLLTMARGERGGMHWVMSAATAGDLDLAGASALVKSTPELAQALKAIPTGLAARHAHAWLLGHLSRFVEIARLPDQQQRQAIQEWGQVARTAPNGARQLLPNAPRLVDACLRHRAMAHCAVAALAAERHRLKNGRWPDKLADLVPKLLPEVPADPYDGQPLRYVRTVDGVTVYSVGPDGKDNGGKVDPANPERPGTDLGFRLWDASKRRWPAGSREGSGE